MKRLLAICLTIFFSIPFCAYSQWITDYTMALNKAKAEDKAILMNFTGSDWCNPCMKLKAEIFEKPEFKNFAAGNLVLLEIDFPRNKSQSSTQQLKNEKLSKQFAVKGYPTVFILDKNGKQLSRTSGYRAVGPQNFVAAIKQLPGFVAKGESSSQPNPNVAAHAATVKKVEAPAYTIPPPVIRYDELALKGISGGRLPMALINNKSLAVGEKAKVKVGDKTVEVLLKEIRDSSVLVQIENESEPRELKMNDQVESK